ncbi:MAG: NAD(P)/FAD-dependent oxidoreductase [Clostridia bacterium]
MEVVIIGSSAASKSAVAVLLKDRDADIKITVISKDRKYYYSRVLLPNFIAGEIDQDGLSFVDEDFFKDKRLRFIRGNVTSIDTDLKRVIIEECGYKTYDKLIITTGSSPKMPYKEASHIDGIYCLRNLEDALEIKKRAQEAKACTVIGGGLVSMKAAWALNSLGKKVTVLVESNRALNKTLDLHCSSMVKDLFEKQGVNIEVGAGIDGFCTQGDKVSGVRLKDGSIIDCDLVVVGKGVKPNTELVKDTAIAIDKGILADNCMRTSVPDIYAAGDVAQSSSILCEEKDLFTLWPDAMEQGKIAAYNILDIYREYQGGIVMNSVKFYGVPFISIGNINDEAKDCSIYTKFNHEKNIYRKVIIKDKRIIGVILAGDVSYAGMIYWDIRSGREVDFPEMYLTREGLEGLYLMRNKQI